MDFSLSLVVWKTEEVWHRITITEEFPSHISCFSVPSINTGHSHAICHPQHSQREVCQLAIHPSIPISFSEIRKSHVFRKYEAGEPTSRLYLKNLPKQVTEQVCIWFIFLNIRCSVVPFFSVNLFLASYIRWQHLIFHAFPMFFFTFYRIFCMSMDDTLIGILKNKLMCEFLLLKCLSFFIFCRTRYNSFSLLQMNYDFLAFIGVTANSQHGCICNAFFNCISPLWPIIPIPIQICLCWLQNWSHNIWFFSILLYRMHNGPEFSGKSNLKFNFYSF